MTESDNKPENKPEDDVNTHEGSNGTDRKGPSGTEEEILRKRIEELRKRDPFIYR